MAAFASVAAADARAQAKGPAGDRTWAYANGGRNMAGAPCVVINRWIGPGPTGGDMINIELTDDATV